MENKVIQDRLALLRKKMQEEGIDFYMMPTADFHNSEYVNDYFKVPPVAWLKSKFASSLLYR